MKVFKLLILTLICTFIFSSCSIVEKNINSQFENTESSSTISSKEQNTLEEIAVRKVEEYIEQENKYYYYEGEDTIIFKVLDKEFNYPLDLNRTQLIDVCIKENITSIVYRHYDRDEIITVFTTDMGNTWEQSTIKDEHLLEYKNGYIDVDGEEINFLLLFNDSKSVIYEFDLCSGVWIEREEYNIGAVSAIYYNNSNLYIGTHKNDEAKGISVFKICENKVEEMTVVEDLSGHVSDIIYIDDSIGVVKLWKEAEESFEFYYTIDYEKTWNVLGF